MTRLIRSAPALLFLAACFTTALALAQDTARPAPQQAVTSTDQAPRPNQPRGPAPAPVNLKALPKTTTGDQIEKLMRQYSGDLGTGCDFCHAPRVPGVRPDRASDANPTKDVARYMILMTADLNDKYLEEMPDRRYADPITCGTCHRGEKHPSIFVPPARPPAGRPPDSGSTPAVTPGQPPAPPVR